MVSRLLSFICCWAVAAAFEDVVMNDLADLDKSLKYLEGPEMGEFEAAATPTRTLFKALWDKMSKGPTSLFDASGKLKIPGSGGIAEAPLKKKVGYQITKPVKKDFEKPDQAYTYNMAAAVGPDCMNLANWKSAETHPNELFADGNQCDSHTNKNYAGVPDATAKGYYPSDPIIKSLGNWLGTPIGSQMKDLSLYGATSQKGMTCGMPGPAGRMENFWNSCVKDKAGYLNVAYCDESTAQAWLGIAMVGPDMCYPAHMHMAEEAYWQIGGTGSWSSWLSFADVSEMKNNLGGVSSVIDAMSKGDGSLVTGSKLYHKTDTAGGTTVVRHHPASVAHEFSTKKGEHMVMLYFWGKSKAAGDNDYRFVRETEGTHHIGNGCVNRFLEGNARAKKVLARQNSMKGVDIEWDKEKEQLKYHITSKSAPMPFDATMCTITKEAYAEVNAGDQVVMASTSDAGAVAAANNAP